MFISEDVHCSSTHNMTALSVFSAISSTILLITTIPLNAIIVYCVGVNYFKPNSKFRSLFYKLLLNIAFADLLKGIFGDTSSLIWHVREAMGKGEDYKKIDVPFVHVSFFFTDAVALVSMTILSVDRIFALLMPFRYLRALEPKTENLIVLSTYPISLCILIPYFIKDIGFINELIIFCACTNSIAVISLILLTSIYRKKFKRPYSASTRNISVNESASGISMETSITNISTVCDNTDISIVTTDDNRSKLRGQSVTETKENEAPIIVKLRRNESAPNIGCKSVITTRTISAPFAVTKVREDESGIKSAKQLNGKQLCDADPHTISIIENKSSSSTSTSCQQQERKRKQSGSIGDISFLSHFTRTNSNTSNLRYTRSKFNRRVTRTFLLMLVVFILTYLPTCVMVVFMKVYLIEHCDVKHVLRDLSVLAILSSSLFRALNFIFSLKHLKLAVMKLSKNVKDILKKT